MCPAAAAPTFPAVRRRNPNPSEKLSVAEAITRLNAEGGPERELSPTTLRIRALHANGVAVSIGDLTMTVRPAANAQDALTANLYIGELVDGAQVVASFKIAQQGGRERGLSFREGLLALTQAARFHKQVGSALVALGLRAEGEPQQWDPERKARYGLIRYVKTNPNIDAARAIDTGMTVVSNVSGGPTLPGSGLDFVQVVGGAPTTSEISSPPLALSARDCRQLCLRALARVPQVTVREQCHKLAELGVANEWHGRTGQGMFRFVEQPLLNTIAEENGLARRLGQEDVRASESAGVQHRLLSSFGPAVPTYSCVKFRGREGMLIALRINEPALLTQGDGDPAGASRDALVIYSVGASETRPTREIYIKDPNSMKFKPLAADKLAADSMLSNGLEAFEKGEFIGQVIQAQRLCAQVVHDARRCSGNTTTPYQLLCASASVPAF